MFHTKKRYLLALYRLEEDMQRVLEKLEGLGTPPSVGYAGSFPEGERPSRSAAPTAPPEGEPPSQSAALTAPPEGEPRVEDEWLREGIDNILSYQAGKKQKEDEQA